MYDCPNGCVTESKMIFEGHTFTCPKCKITGKWMSKRDKMNQEGHPFVLWSNGKKTINPG